MLLALLLWLKLHNKITSEIYDVIVHRFKDFNSEPNEKGYETYKDECEDFIVSFIDFSASDNENLLPSFDDYVASYN